MKENQLFYNSRTRTDRHYLTEDHAASFLATTYDFYANNDKYKTDVMQFMELDFKHSGKPPVYEYAKFRIDLHYIRTDRAKSNIAPRTDRDDIDLNASYRLAMTFRKYGLGIDTRSPTYGVITEDRTGTKSFFPGFSRIPGHQDHIHLQGFKFDYLINIYK